MTKFDFDLDKAIDQAANTADAKTRAQQEKLVQLPREQLAALFPTPADREELDRLLKAVKGCTDEAQRVKALEGNARAAARVLSKLLRVIV